MIEGQTVAKLESVEIGNASAGNARSAESDANANAGKPRKNGASAEIVESGSKLQNGKMRQTLEGGPGLGERVALVSFRVLQRFRLA